MTFNIREYGEFRRGEGGKTFNDYTLSEGAFSINIIGDGYEDFSQELSENFLWTGSNFSNNNNYTPDYPIIGQLWHDSRNRTLNVYDSDCTWTEVSTALPSGVGISEDITPSSDSQFVIGDINHRFKYGHVSEVYVDKIIYANTNGTGSGQNITIDKDGNSSLSRASNLYPSVGGNSSLMEDLDEILAIANSSTAPPWRTNVTLFDSGTTNNVTVNVGTNRVHEMAIISAANVGYAYVEMGRNVDSICTLVNSTPNPIRVYLRATDTNLNFIHGHNYSQTHEFVIQPQRTGKITTFKTNHTEIMDVIIDSRII